MSEKTIIVSVRVKPSTLATLVRIAHSQGVKPKGPSDALRTALESLACAYPAMQRSPEEDLAFLLTNNLVGTSEKAQRMLFRVEQEVSIASQNEECDINELIKREMTRLGELPSEANFGK